MIKNEGIKKSSRHISSEDVEEDQHEATIEDVEEEKHEAPESVPKVDKVAPECRSFHYDEERGRVFWVGVFGNSVKLQPPQSMIFQNIYYYSFCDLISWWSSHGGQNVFEKIFSFSSNVISTES